MQDNIMTFVGSVNKYCRAKCSSNTNTFLTNVPVSLSPMCSNGHHHKPAMWLKRPGGELDPFRCGPQLQRQSGATGWKHQFSFLCQRSVKLHSACSPVRIDV